MSYCVNCGVELDKSAKKCALCDTPVYNPNEQTEQDAAASPFSDIPVIPSGVKKRFVALIVTFILLIPNIVCFFVNLFFSPDTLWFVYVLSSCLLAWVMFVFPFLTKKLYPYLMWAFDSASVALYIFVFYTKTPLDGRWYVGIALPVVAAVSLCVLYYIHWLKKRKRHWTSKMLHIFIDSVIVFTVFSACFFFFDSLILCEIFLIIDLCCFTLTFFFLYANKSKKVRAWLAKKLFV